MPDFPMEFLTRLQDSALAQWVGGAETLLAYPTILTLHTVGLSIVVGTCVVIDLRILGVAREAPLSALRRAPLLVWSAFIVNAVTGVLLFLPSAEQKAFQTIFYVKLACIAVALFAYARIRALVFRDAASLAAPIPPEARTFAVVSLIFWTGATVAGRLMAYIL
jgi:hypothetical protein